MPSRPLARAAKPATANATTASASTVLPRFRRWRVIAGILVVVITFGLYFRVVGFSFLLHDDTANILTNPWLNPPSWPHVAQFWKKPYLGLYIPVTYTLWSAEAYLSWQTDVAGGRIAQVGPIPVTPALFHGSSLILHCLATILVYGLLLRLVDRPSAAACGALLFAMHPLVVESVGFITETKGLLSGVGCLVALRLLIGCWNAWPVGSRWPDRVVGDSRPARMKSGSRVPTDKVRAAAYYALATLFFVTAMLSKPSAAALPLVAAVLAIGWLRLPWSRVLFAVGPWVLVAAMLTILTKGVQNATVVTFAPPPWQRVFVAGDTLAFYLAKLCCPWPLGADYGRSSQYVVEHSWAYFTWLAPAGVVGVLMLLPGRRQWLTAAAVFVAALLPVLGLVPFAHQNASTVADRYAYLAMVGPALGMAALLKDARWSRFAPAIAVLTVWAALSYRQLGSWVNDRAWIDQTLAVNSASFFGLEVLAQTLDGEQRTAEASVVREKSRHLNPRAIEPYLNLGKSLLAQGNQQAARDCYLSALVILPESRVLHGFLADISARLGDDQSAQRHFRRAIDGLDRDSMVSAQCNQMGQVYVQRGRLDLAREALNAALRLRPDSIVTLNDLAVLDFRQGRIAEAQSHWTAVLAIDPTNVATLSNRAVAFFQSGNVEAAIADLTKAVANAPRDIKVRAKLVDVLLRSGRVAYAIEQYRDALRWQRDWRDGQRQLAWLLATHPDSRIRNGREAVAIAEQFCTASGFRDPVELDVLAAAQAESQSIDEAIVTGRRAVELWRAANRPAEAAVAERRLQCYERREPWRESLNSSN